MLDQKLQQKLQQKLSSQQIQVIKMLEIPAIELEQRIKEEMEENPALEIEEQFDDNLPEQNEQDDNENTGNEDDEFSIDDYFNEDEYSNYKFKDNNAADPSEHKEIPFSVGSSFHESLYEQLSLLNLSEHEMVVADFIIGNIDDKGYLCRDLEHICDDIMFALNVETSEQELQHILTLVQTLDPAGVGARNFQECLLLQITRKPKTAATLTAAEILRHHYTAFTQKHYEKILQALEIEREDLKCAIDEIVKLNLNPGNAYSDALQKGTAQYITPDFIIENTNGRLSVQLHSRNEPELHVSKAYIDMYAHYKQGEDSSKANKEAAQFIRQKIDSAKWFIDAIKQRKNTLLSTMQAIFEYQKAFFETGDKTHIKPMILKDIAEIVELDVSTISRVANSKYVQTPYGTFLLKFFFSEGMKTDAGEEVSSREIKTILSESIQSENKQKPYTDEQLTEILTQKGYVIARRTVAKYREQLDIPIGRLRKEV
ncbi:MAG: RNA polymerase factor sigma-54 [Bacteroidales bacterium]|jgi:RNA polymerase sigma-54 factor|nr:RNA polymerase factor sigma-54 [Bacteroidales bacterium]